MAEKAELLDNVKKECKKVMEEAVTKKFVHTDSSSVTQLCNAVESCILHRLKKRVGGLLPAVSCSDDVLSKLAKYCPSAETIFKVSTHLQHVNEMKQKTIDNNNLSTPERKQVSGYHITGFCSKYLWIRLALLERELTDIITSLIDYSREFYEPDALLADHVDGLSLVWLLDGPCSLDYSKMKTPDNSWYDPTAFELVQRHRIYSSPSMNHAIEVSKQRRRLFSVTSMESQPTIPGVPILAREHVDSLHQNAENTLLYGKNNVMLDLRQSTQVVFVRTADQADFPSPVQGYLSLHRTTERQLLLKWTPNPMLHTNDRNEIRLEKNQFWNQAVTVNFTDIVYLHCHNAGDCGGSLVLISQDGVQLPPLLFPTGGSILAFLTCLDQGLSPNGRLDPPLFNKTASSSIQWPRFKTHKLPDKLLNVFQDADEENERLRHDFVFRIIFTTLTSNIDTADLKNLLSTDSNMNINPPRSRGNRVKTALIPNMHAGRLQRGHRIPSRVVLNLACEKMKQQILGRAFNGWIASYRHLKTVRTHLATLVLPLRNGTLPGDINEGLTAQTWERLKSDGLRNKLEEVRQYVYYGGIEHSIRHEVWPHLLGQYIFNPYSNNFTESESSTAANYQQILDECKGIEEILQVKEKDLLALNGFANGETFGHGKLRHHQDDALSVKTNDTLEIDVLNDSVSRDLSIGSNTSFESKTEKTENENKKEFSLIKSILDTKDNLRDMVESASQRGQSAWKMLVKKKNQRVDNKSNQETFDAFRQTFHSKPTLVEQESFDLELVCQTCQKHIIESRQSVENGKLNDNNIETVECFACMQERKVSQHYNDEVSPYKRSPISVLCDQNAERKTKDGDIVVINGEGTPLQQKRYSESSFGSSYSEDLLKDFALNIHRIDKDVLRCDRAHPYFADEKNLEKLRNIIMCYVWERLNIGYIQGMCDLCAPFLVIFDDEPKAYGCFLELMNRMTHNFPHGTAMDMHLSNIASLIQILDPQLHELLDAHGDNTIFYFAYRWFLLDFKRELKYDDVFLVWETIWAATTVSSEHFNLFVALAIIELYREIIIDNQMDFTDIIKFFNEMAEQHEVRATLNLARNIVKKLQDIMHPGDNDVVMEIDINED